MPPANPHIISQLRQLIYYHLDCNLLRNALFAAGRLHAYEPRSSEAAYLLALCHLRLGQLKAAYDNSRNSGSRGTHLGCSYVFAQACLGLERYVEGVTALDRSKGLWSSRNTWGMSYGDKCSGRCLQEADSMRCRQAHGHSKTTSPRRFCSIVFTRKAMAGAFRYKQSYRMLCRGAEAQPVHVGCFPRIVRPWYVDIRSRF